jgi:hypothetical protein
MDRAASPSLPRPLSPSLPTDRRARGENYNSQKALKGDRRAPLFSRTAGGRRGEESRGDEGPTNRRRRSPTVESAAPYR